MGCGGDRTQDGDSRIEGGCSTISTGQKSEKYSILVTNKKGEVLENASVTLGGEQCNTNQKGFAIFSKPSESIVNLIVTCEGYEGVMYSSYSIKEKSVDTISLQAKDSEAHRLKKALYKNGIHSADLLTQNKRFYQDGPDICFNMEVEVIGEKESVSKYEFCQDVIEDGQSKTKVIRSSANGYFENIKVSELAIGTKMYVRVVNVNGQSVCTALNLEKASKPSYEGEKELSLFGDSFSFEVDDDVPIIGGTQIDMKSLTFPVFAKTKEDEDGNVKVQIGFNVDISKNEDKDELQKILEKFEAAGKVTYDKESYCKKLKQLQKQKGKFAIGGFESIGKPEITFIGYAEGGFDSYGELSSVTGKMVLVIKEKLSDGSWQFVVSTTPVVVQLEGEIAAETSGAITYDFNKNELSGKCKVDITPELTLKGGAGVKGASLEIYGSAKFPLELIIADPEYKTGINSFDVSAEIGVYGEFLVFETKKKIKNGSYNIWSRGENGYKDNVEHSNGGGGRAWNRGEKDDLVVLKNYSPLSNSENKISTVEKYDNGNLNGFTLNVEASKNAAPVMASNGKHAMSVYSSQQNMDGAENSYAKLYYSIYENGEWTDGISVDDTVCNEMNPQIVNNGDDYYILYQESQFDYSQFDQYDNLADEEKDELIRNYAKSIELHMKKYNMSTKTFIDCGILQTKDEYDYGAEIELLNGVPYICWLKNSNGDVFGTDKNTETDIMTAKYTSGQWKTNCIKTTKKLVTQLEIGNYAKGITYSYTEDEDKNVDTDKDVNTYIYKDNEEKCIYSNRIDAIKYSKASDGNNGNFYLLSGNCIYQYNPESDIKEVANGINCFNNEFYVVGSTLYYAALSDGCSELFRAEKNGEGVFSNPIKISDNKKWIRNITVSNLESKDTVLCLAEDFDAESENVDSQIMIYQIGEYMDMQIDNPEFIDIDIESSSSEEKAVTDAAISVETQDIQCANVSFDIKNNGTKTIDTFAIAISDAQGQPVEVVDNDYSKSLHPGERMTANVKVKLTETTSFGEWSLECTAKSNQEEENTEKNIAVAFRAGTSRLSVDSQLYNCGAYTYLIANVKNTGRLTDSATLEIKNANDVNQVFSSTKIEDLKPGDVHVFKVKIPESWCDDNGKAALLISIKDMLYDTNVFDDFSYEYATLNYGRYNINYVLNGGELSNGISTYTTTSSFDFPKPRRNGYYFKGWYSNSNMEEQSKVSSVAYGSAGDMTLYAKWEEKSSDTTKKTPSTAYRKNTGKQKTSSVNKSKPKRVKSLRIKNLKKRKLNAKWKKLKGVSGYQVQYALSKKMKKAKLKNCKVASITIKKLKKRKTYYVRVRAYKYVNGKKVYGKWSSIKKIKIKK